MGVVAALAGVEHGVGELLRSGSADGLVIESWPDTTAFEPLSGEPAMTLIPGLRVAGLATIALSVALAWWSLRTEATRRDGWPLLGLSVALLLVGGGFGPPLVGLTLAVALLTQGAPDSGGVPGPRRVRLAGHWRVLLGVTVAAFLALFPGVVLLAWVGLESTVLVALLPVVAFAGLVLTLVAARAHDRLEARPLGQQRPRPAATFDLAVAIRRTPEAVWALLADVQDHVGSTPTHAEVRMVKEPAGPTVVGTRWHERVKMAPGYWMTVESVATRVAAPRELGMDFRSRWFTGHLDYVVEASPGGCVLHQREAVRPRRLLRWAGAPMATRLRPRLEQRLDDIRVELEGAGRSGQPGSGPSAWPSDWPSRPD